MKLLNTPTYLLALGLALAAGSPVLAYDCANAPDDIKRLRAEKDSTAERVAKGISAILPIGIVVHAIKGNEEQTLDEMGTDEHNQRLDARIRQIKSHCDIR